MNLPLNNNAKNPEYTAARHALLASTAVAALIAATGTTRTQAEISPNDYLGVQTPAANSPDSQSHPLADARCHRDGLKTQSTASYPLHSLPTNVDGDGDPTLFELEDHQISLLSVDNGAWFDIDDDSIVEQPGSGGRSG